MSNNFADQSHNQPASKQDDDDVQDNKSVPLLLTPSYARSSKSSMFDELRHFRISLKWCALDHSSPLGKFISYFTFIILAILVPILCSFSVEVPSSEPSNDPILFNKLVQLPESGLTIIAFLTLCRFFRTYGLRQLLFLDSLQEDSTYIRRRYTLELDKAFRWLAFILLPSFFMELAHKIIFFSIVNVSIPCIVAEGVFPMNSIVFFMSMASWVYRTGVFLLVCVLFRLTCELQILRLEGFSKMLEERWGESSSGVIFDEHLRIREQLCVTSHRYRVFIIGCLITVTVSQSGTLLLVLATKSNKSFFNSGDLVVCSAVELSGFLLCLMGAARITHRAQKIVSVATRWHMHASCNISSKNSDTTACIGTENSNHSHCADSADPKSDNDQQNFVHDQENQNDLESSSDVRSAVSPLEASSFETRQALVSYLEHNNGGITLFGFALDRGLLHALFAFEFSLVLWILSKVVVLS